MLKNHVQYGLSAEYRLAVAIDEANDFGANNVEYSGDHSSVLVSYEEFGYVIVRKLIQPSLCDELIAAFRREVKPFSGHLLRQASARPGPHLFTPDGLVEPHVVEMRKPCNANVIRTDRHGVHDAAQVVQQFAGRDLYASGRSCGA